MAEVKIAPVTAAPVADDGATMTVPPVQVDVKVTAPDAPAPETSTTDESTPTPAPETETTDESTPTPAAEDDATESTSAPPKPKRKAAAKKPKAAVVKKDKKDNHGTYVDENNIRVPKRRVKVSKIFYVWGVKHGEPIDISKQEPVCLTHFTASAVARIFTVKKLKEDGKVVGRRDIYLQERGVESIKTSGYVVTRRRNKDVKEVKFKQGGGANQDSADGENKKCANFSITSKQKVHFLNKKNLKSFRQQIMSRAGLSQEEIDAVETDVDLPLKDKNGNPVVESDIESEDEATAGPVSNEEEEDEEEAE